MILPSTGTVHCWGSIVKCLYK